MDIIKTGITISKTIRNVGRLREIVTIFARNGFDEFVSLGVSSKIPIFKIRKSKKEIQEQIEKQTGRNWWQVLGHRLRKSFEELGPAFIKFGQLLGSREDIFDPEFITEMNKLRDKVKSVPWEESKKIIETSLGGPISDFFLEIDEKPLGTASIGTAYRAVLKSGKEVVVKVRRPNIEKVIETDFSIMLFLAGQLEKASDEIRFLGLTRVLSDFAIGLKTELNFNIEAMNCQRFKKNMDKRDKEKVFHVPEIYEDLVHEDILVMEYMQGIPFSDTDALADKIPELSEKLNVGVRYFMQSFLQDGFFHADLHGGNFFLLENGKIGIIDYGLMGTLGKKGRQSFIAIVYALLTYNFENLVLEFLDVAEYEGVPDVELLVSDVRDALSPYIGLTVQQTNYTEVFRMVMLTLNRHRLFLPRDWFIVFRALMTLDGAGKSLGVDFDIFGIMEGDIPDMIKGQVSREEVIEEAIWAARDILPSLRILPRHLKWFVKDLSKRNYAFEVVSKGHEKELDNIAGALTFGGFAILSSVLFWSGVHVLGTKSIEVWTDIPTVCWVFWASGFFIFLRGSFFLTR